MLQLIKNYLKKLSKKEDTKLDASVGSVCFDIFSDEKVNIKCFFPYLEDVSEDSIIEYAEHYALMLHNISSGLYTESIINILNTNIDKNNYKDVLFLNNLFSFWAILHAEKKELDKKSQKEPLIRPTDFFKKTQ
jgi:hypothetical protein